MRVLAFATVAATLLAPHCVSALEKPSVQSAATCLPNYSWMDNLRGDSPCYLMGVVWGSCQGNSESGPTSVSQDLPSIVLAAYLVPSLDSSYYNAPNSETANVCSW